MSESNESRLRAALQAGPIPMRLEPLFGQDFLGGEEAAHYAIYTEPEDAPGREEVLATLKEKMAGDVTTLPWAEEPLLGETLEDADWSVGAAEEVSLSTDEVVGQVINYRLILARALEPIGFCTFAINIDDYGVFFPTLCELWMEAPYRDTGIELGFMRQMADAIYATIAALDTRIGNGESVGIDVTFGCEFTSSTTDSMLQACAAMLQERLDSPGASNAARLQRIGVSSVGVA